MASLRWTANGRTDRAVVPQGVVARLLQARVCDLDVLSRQPEIRAAIESFAPSYLLIALPKSSSTYTTEVLSRILDADVHKDIVVQDRFTPKDLYIPGIVQMRDRVSISQVHMIASGANLRTLNTFRMPVVVLLRNLFDVVVSMRDHMNRNPYFSSILIPNAYDKLSDTDKLDYIIDTAIPWMITFYVSWAQAMSRNDIDTEFFFYEDMVSQPASFFRKISARFGRQVSDANVNKALACVEKSAATRFNVGKPGRGILELNDAQIARIRRHADYYPGVDFTPLGL